ncbi:MAG TPA: hypothetical protein EYH40_05335 [Desulfurococcales archaeon]|nr:hypothetical protein [Desulfurococcales archaeon]
MGRRRKKYKKIVKRVRKIPSIFQCPHCGRISLTVEINKERTKAIIQCGSCGLQSELEIAPIFQPVDVYGKFIDMYHSGVAEVKFVKSEEAEET